ncbi:hypothetical protein SAMN06265379_101474 [Saccharicrinis carchari]|uniref:Uncharacterized protein n=1 Tax=Saccharicrinis carchari TaxID=1168039 RepID=A0A521AXC3_SACCC|nr:hypothetical protein [Saccharicrinis carchari]SMO39180.1 hypothetical protein SAMN06265379_101474 [Saccharicrinis carchari]
MKKIILYSSVTVLAIFGLLTLFLSTSIILDLFGIREMKGNFVPFVVWANFISSILYLSSAYGFVKQEKWTAKVLGASAVILMVAYAGLFAHIKSGGLYEVKTVGAMAFRIGVTLMFTAVAFFTINRRRK